MILTEIGRTQILDLFLRLGGRWQYGWKESSQGLRPIWVGRQEMLLGGVEHRDQVMISTSPKCHHELLSSPMKALDGWSLHC